MSIDAITKKIISDTEEKSVEIIKKAEAEARVIIAEARKDSDEYARCYLTREEEKYKSAANQILVEARLARRNQLLQEEHSQISQVFELLRKNISKLHKQDKVVITYHGQKKESLDEELFLREAKKEFSSLVQQSLGLVK